MGEEEGGEKKCLTARPAQRVLHHVKERKKRVDIPVRRTSRQKGERKGKGRKGPPRLVRSPVLHEERGKAANRSSHSPGSAGSCPAGERKEEKKRKPCGDPDISSPMTITPCSETEMKKGEPSKGRGKGEKKKKKKPCSLASTLAAWNPGPRRINSDCTRSAREGKKEKKKGKKKKKKKKADRITPAGPHNASILPCVGVLRGAA